jgi:hypothetical protein
VPSESLIEDAAMSGPNRASALVFALSCLAVTGCTSHPNVHAQASVLTGTAELQVGGLALGAEVEACGVKGKGRFPRLLVPFECVLPPDTLLVPKNPIESNPIELTVKPLVGARRSFTKTVTLEVMEQERFVEGWLHSVSSGTPLPASDEKRGASGIAFVGLGHLRTTGAKTVADVALVVLVKPVNERDAGRTCRYDNLMNGALRAWDADLDAFDARTAKKVASKHLVNRSPGCPSTNFGRMGESNQVSSYPSDREMEEWARTVRLDAGDE